MSKYLKVSHFYLLKYYFFRYDRNIIIFPLIKFCIFFVRLILQISYCISLIIISNLYTYVNLKKLLVILVGRRVLVIYSPYQCLLVLG